MKEYVFCILSILLFLFVAFCHCAPTCQVLMEVDVAAAFLLFYIVICICLSWYDWRNTLLPDRLTCPLLWAGLLFNLICLPQSLPDAVLGAAIGYGLFSLFYWLYRVLRGYEGLGYGDVKLLAALGAWHGWQSISAIVLIASLSGLSVAGVFVLKGSVKDKKTPLPFGPFLVAAGFCVSWPTFGQLIVG